MGFLDKIKVSLFGELLEYNAQDVDSGKSGYFKFKIIKKGGAYRAYILERPSLNGREGNLQTVHMLRDGSKYYVCVVQRIYSADKAKAVARLWARKYLRYVISGKKYEEV